MRVLQLLSIAVLFTAGVPAFAAGPSVSRGVVTTGITGRAPVDVVAVLPATVGRLYCFTRVVGAADTTVTHVWYWGDKEVARVTLPVRSADWRTWSSKRVLPSWKGKWRVEVRDAAGQLLKTIPFTLQ